MLIWFYSGLLIPFISSSHNESSILRAGVFNSFHGKAYFSFITPWGKNRRPSVITSPGLTVPVSPWQNSPKIRERLLSSAQETSCHLLHKDGERHLPTMKKKKHHSLLQLKFHQGPYLVLRVFKKKGEFINFSFLLGVSFSYFTLWTGKL